MPNNQMPPREKPQIPAKGKKKPEKGKEIPRKEKRDVWDEHLREQLFAVLTWEFGPLKYWEAKSRPFKSGGAFQEFLSKMSQHFSNLHGHDLSPDAIKSQINYVLQRPKGAEYNIKHQDNFRRNIKAAVKTGFISMADLKKRLGKGDERDDDRARQRQMQRGKERQQRMPSRRPE